MDTDVMRLYSGILRSHREEGNPATTTMCVDWDAEVAGQEIPQVTGTFGLGVKNEAGERLTECCQENTLVIENILFQQHKRQLCTWT